jgi:hypothetical protein
MEEVLPDLKMSKESGVSDRGLSRCAQVLPLRLQDHQ